MRLLILLVLCAACAHAVERGKSFHPHPWFALLKGRDLVEDKESIFCGGTVVGRRWILTAAHCLTTQNEKSANFKVVVGMRSQCEGPSHKSYTAETFFRHEKFSIFASELNYDIALIQTKEEILFSNHVQPISLPRNDSILKLWDSATAFEFVNTGAVRPCPAAIRENGPLRRAVEHPRGRRSLKVEAVVFPASLCHNTKHQINEDLMICFGSFGMNPCRGYSGGPLLRTEPSGVTWQYGIASTGRPFCSEQTAAGFTRVSLFCDWIQKQTSGEVMCKNNIPSM